MERIKVTYFLGGLISCLCKRVEIASLCSPHSPGSFMEIIAQDFGVISIDIGSVHIYIVDSIKV